MQVEIWSDLACPWCYVGKRRFEAALREFEHRDEVDVTWRSFELDPGAPAERPGDRDEQLARKYGVTRAEAEAMHERMSAVAAGEGLRFDFSVARSGSTFDAHRLLQLARLHGCDDALAERLFSGYLGEGELLSDHETLTRLASEAGLAADEVTEVLASDRFATEVRQDEGLAAAAGIAAVPCFVIDRRIGASGAQDPEVLLAFLREGWARAQVSS